MTPTVLVVTTVHNADDTRIRERLIRSLAVDFHVVYAARTPGPSDTEAIEWVALGGGRFRRDLKALWTLLRRAWDVAVIHDPELVVPACLARLIRGRPVVFDVHEDLAAQIGDKTWIPVWARSGARILARWLYAMGERFLILTLAEPEYGRLFRKDHPVFPNYPCYLGWPQPQSTGNGSAVYLGDVQPGRGVIEAVEASARAGLPLLVIGPVSEGMRRDIEQTAARNRAEVHMTGRLPNPEAIARVNESSVGLSPLRDLPNYAHSLPTKTLEYLGAGVPVVATDLPGTRDHIGDLAGVRLVASGDIDSMAAAIGESATVEVKRQAVEQSSLIRERYRWPDEEVRAFYGTLVTK